jgi:hypothetical protein
MENHLKTVLVSKRWNFSNSFDDDVTSVEFCENGTMNFDGRKNDDRQSPLHQWWIIDNQVYFSLNKGYAFFHGSFSFWGDQIVGVATNINKENWRFKLSSYDSIFFSHFTGISWKSVDFAIDDVGIIQFKEWGELNVQRIDGSKWSVDHKWQCTYSDKVKLTFNNGDLTFLGVIQNNNIVGDARTLKGKEWKCEFIKILPLPPQPARRALRVDIVDKAQRPSEIYPSWFEPAKNFLAQDFKSSKLFPNIKYMYNVLDHYYPKNRYPNAPVDVQNYRNFIYRFKDGLGDCYLNAAIDFASAISNLYGVNKLDNTTIGCVIPASSEELTIARFKKFNEKICTLLKISNGFKVLKNIKTTGAAHLGEKVRGDISNINIDGKLISGKRVFLFDDVMTTGRSFIAISDQMIKFGAIEVVGFYLGKTYDRTLYGEPAWNSEFQSNISQDADELPF